MWECNMQSRRHSEKFIALSLHASSCRKCQESWGLRFHPFPSVLSVTASTSDTRSQQLLACIDFGRVGYCWPYSALLSLPVLSIEEDIISYSQLVTPSTTQANKTPGETSHREVEISSELVPYQERQISCRARETSRKSTSCH